MKAFWDFWTAEADARPILFLRFATAVVGLVQLALLWPYLLHLYGNHGLVQWAIIEEGNASFVPTIGKVALAGAALGIPTATTLHTVFAVYGAALVALLIRRHSRAAAIVALVAHTLTVGSGFLSMYGVDTMLHVSLFYLCWFPTRPGAGARIAHRVLQLHVVLLYLDTGLAKASGAQWWNGEALWRAMMQPKFAMFDYAWLADFPHIVQAAGIAVVILEIAYPLVVWWRPARLPALAAIVALHAGIGILMGLWLFSAMMIALNLCAFGRPLLDAVATELDRLGRSVTHSIRRHYPTSADTVSDS